MSDAETVPVPRALVEALREAFAVEFSRSTYYGISSGRDVWDAARALVDAVERPTVGEDEPPRREVIRHVWGDGSFFAHADDMRCDRCPADPVSEARLPEVTPEVLEQVPTDPPVFTRPEGVEPLMVSEGRCTCGESTPTVTTPGPCYWAENAPGVQSQVHCPPPTTPREELAEVRKVWANCKRGWRLPRDVIAGMDAVLSDPPAGAATPPTTAERIADVLDGYQKAFRAGQIQALTEAADQLEQTTNLTGIVMGLRARISELNSADATGERGEP